MKQIVWVVMGNDYPTAVFSNENSAKKFCVRKAAENEKREAEGYGKIYWRSYNFVLDGEN